MGEELLPGLVKVVEERMGLVGRPFTTVIVIAAGLGVIAWGAGTVLMVGMLPRPYTTSKRNRNLEVIIPWFCI